MERVSVPGKYLVDILPCLLWLPSWLAPFKKEAAAHQRREVSLFSSLVENVRNKVDSGKAGPSFTRLWLENKQKFGLSDIQGTYVLGGLYSAAASTTASLAQSWVLLMVHNPEWLTKMQEEIDRVVGPERLPVFDDLPQLPLVRAVVKEVARMRPVTAGGESNPCGRSGCSNLSLTFLSQAFPTRVRRTMSIMATLFPKEASSTLTSGMQVAQPPVTSSNADICVMTGPSSMIPNYIPIPSLSTPTGGLIQNTQRTASPSPNIPT